MDESSSRFATQVGTLRRGTGISLRNQSNEERPSQYNNKPGKNSNLNPVRARWAENKEKPRPLHQPFHSPNSKASSSGSSKVPVRKYYEERQKRPFLAEADVAKSSNMRGEARRLQTGKKVVIHEDMNLYRQQAASEGSSSTISEGGLPEEPDLGVLDFSVSSGSSSHMVASVTRNTALSAKSSRHKDKELNTSRPQGASTFVRRTVPQSSSIGLKSSSSPGTTSTGLQRRGLKNLGCTSISDVLPSGCSSPDSVHNRRVGVMKKRTADVGSSSRSRGISEQANLGQPLPLHPGRTTPTDRAAEQSAFQQRARTSSRSIQDSTDSVRARRPTCHARERMTGEIEGGIFAMRETVTRVHNPERGHLPTDDVSPQRLARPFYAELPHAIYSSNRQGSNNRTTRRRSSSRPEERPPQMFHGLFGDRDGYRRINMGGIAEVLLALDRIEQDDELTYEQLLVLETNLLLSGLGLHDQHQDMRLDIDNMSYEELLALEEQIGSVSTALSEEQFLKCVNRSVYRGRNSDEEVNKIAVDDVKCSICQEEYLEGEEIGRMRCEHQYHVGCIHEWLRQKNWCPICKASAMPSEIDNGGA